MNFELDKDWRALLADEFSKPYFGELQEFVEQRYEQGEVFPAKENIFRALNKCPLDKLKVVILGQDPYHNVNQANGLCFSVSDGVKFPPSLKNIFKEINSDLGIEIPLSGELDRWAGQGVLLLNAVLTVDAHKPESHAKKGWETFTDAIVREISQKKSEVVYMLWGSYAQRKCSVIDSAQNCVLESVHPSPLSAYRGFFGCKHFSKANEYLVSLGKEPINW